jgi:hypothetical protein
MAEFSKQYCEMNNMGFEGDFDILEEFDTLSIGYYKSMICEGFGFVALAKDVDGRCLVGLREDDSTVLWESYDIFINKQK